MIIFLKLSRFFLFLTALTPLVVGNNIFPFVFDKLIFFRSLVELSFILLLIYIVYQLYYGNFSAISSKLKELVKNPLIIFIFLFLTSALLSSLSAVNSYRAFWGDLERGEGVFALIHYVIFFLIAFLVFHRKDWLRFFKISLIISLVLIVFAFLQLPIFGIEKLPLNLNINDRPGSLLGNPSFLASYMIFTLLFAIIVIRQSIYSEKNLFNKLWFWFGCFIIPIAILAILITGTRGALLGLAAGVFAMLIYFSVYKNTIFFNVIKFARLNLRKLSIFLLAVIIIFSGIFWFTRDNFFWQKIPGLNRLAQTRLLNANDSSTMVRFMTWKLSWEAFKEKPFFGWGPDNYLIAFEKYYNPDLALYGEGLWIDRAHNKIIDIAVMRGILGLTAYLGIFTSFFYLLFKKYNNYIAPFFAAGIIAYFIQNLFLFDHISSYLVFFAFFGFFVSSLKHFNNELVAVGQNQPFKYKFILSIAISAIIIALIYSLYFYNYIPYRQASDFWKSTENTDINVLLNQLERATNPYNFAQYNIRGKGIDLIYLDQYFENEKYISNPKFDKLGDFLIKIMDDFIAREPYDIRLLMKQVEALNAVARAYPEKSESLYKKGEAILRKAMVISPNRQEVYYHLAFNLANQKRFVESITIARSAVDLSPKVARAHYHFGFILFLAGDNNEGVLKEFKIVEELDARFLTLLIGDINNILLIYEKLGKVDKVSEIAKMTAEDNKNDIQPAFYLSALKYYAKNHEQQNFIKIASHLAKSPHLKDAMDIFIKLAEKNLWDEIEEYQ